METLVVFPDLLESNPEIHTIHSDTFSAFFDRKLSGKNVLSWMGIMDREPAEKRPNPLGVRIRQLVVNVMVFEVPDDLYDALQQKDVFDAVPKPETYYDEAMRIVNEAKLLGTMKLKNSGESRLVGKLASGLGGHVDASDVDLRCKTIDDVLRIAAIRELCDEELTADLIHQFRSLVNQRIRPLAILNSDYGEVESVHMGFVYVLAVPKRMQVKIAEVDKLEAVWVPVSEFSKQLEMFQAKSEGHYQLDRWTQLLFGLSSLFVAEKIILSIR